VLALLLAACLTAATPEVKVEAHAEGDEVAVRLVIPPKLHLQANPAGADLIPTTVTFKPSAGVEPVSVTYPPGEMWRPKFGGSATPVYSDSVTIRTRFRGPPGPRQLEGIVRYQACDEMSCLAPEELYFDCEIVLAADSPPAAAPVVTALSPEIAPWSLWYFLALFAVGIGLNLTPCVYPLIPVTVGFFGRRALDGSRAPAGVARLFAPLAYTFALAVTFALIGLFAAATGAMLGSLLTHPALLVAISLVLVALAFWSFGLFELRLPLPALGTGGGGIGGALFLGATAGLVAAPCIGPVVAGLFLLIARTGDLLFGFLALGMVGLGMALPLALLAWLSATAVKLPRAGAWMVWVKRLFGVILLIGAVYPLLPLLGVGIAQRLAAVLAVCGGLWLGFLDLTPGSVRFRVARALVGVALVAAGFWLFTLPTASAITFRDLKDIDPASAGAPYVVDVFADWCLPCLELDHTTFSDPRVVEAAEGIFFFRADVTRGIDVPFLAGRNVVGVPTILFFRADNTEIEELRLVGYEPPDAFLKRLERYRALLEK